MWDGYIFAIKEFVEKHPQMEDTETVIDRFHIAQAYRKVCDKVRKEECQRLKKELSKEVYKNDVKGIHWPLRYNHDRLSDEDRKRQRKIFEYSPKLKLVYTYREELTAIFNQDLSKEQASKRLNKWIDKVTKSDVYTCYKEFIKTLQNRFELILNYFSKRKNSGFVEGINNKLKSLTRRCFGIKNISMLNRRMQLDMCEYITLF